MFDSNKSIGNTPIIKIYYEYKGLKKYVYTKLEYYNLTGSIKDRVAFYIIKKAKERGELKENMPIVEATSGNTGIALSAIGTFYKHPVYIFMPDWVSKERIKIMEGYGAKVFLISREDGGFVKCVSEAKKFAEEKGGFLANQFANKDNLLAHYETTGKEIIDKINEELGGFVSGVGTGGTIMGTGKRLKEEFKNLKITAIEPDKLPIISMGTPLGEHKIEGIGDDFIPDLIDKKEIDEVILINDEDAINMSRKLARELGLGVGISSGANLIGSILLSEKVKEPVATVFADDNKKYLSTSLLDAIDNDLNFISNNVKLISYEVL